MDELLLEQRTKEGAEPMLDTYRSLYTMVVKQRVSDGRKRGPRTDHKNQNSVSDRSKKIYSGREAGKEKQRDCDSGKGNK